MSVCAPPVLLGSLVSTMHHSHSMGVFNSLLIKRICILFVVFPAFALQINFPAESLSHLFLQFYVTLMVKLQIVRWITWPSIFCLCSGCVTDSRDMCLSHICSSSLAFSLLSSDIILKWWAAAMLKDWLWPKGLWVVGLILLVRKFGQQKWVNHITDVKTHHWLLTGCAG